MSLETIRQIQSAWPKPAAPRPIVIIGSGGIVNDAHLPAYRKAGFPVAGIFDVDPAKAATTAKKFSVDKIFPSLHDATATPNCVLDIAVPPEHTLNALSSVPERAIVLLQKPMGMNLEHARRIRDLCVAKRLTAALNFQFRFSPMMLAVRDAIKRGLLGQVIDLELRFNCRTPWELFPFLEKLDRVEIQIHSVHYLDWIRSILGNPTGVFARTVGHPSYPRLKSTRSSIILDYGDNVRCCLSINHNYEFGPEYQDAALSIQGTKGAAVAKIGVQLSYPHGEAETVRITTRDTPWTDVPLSGRWFPDGFVGRMANLQRFITGEDDTLISDVHDAFQTMALVEACYISNAGKGTPLPTDPTLPTPAKEATRQ